MLDPVAFARDRSRPREMTNMGRDVIPPDRTSRKSDKERTKHRIVEDLVAGIFIDGREFLVEKRRDDKDVDPGYIEIPGGHVEKDETLEDALKREMKEELGIDVERAKFVQRSLYTASNGERGRIHYFHVEKWIGRIVSNEAGRVYWESKVSNLTILPDKKAIQRVLGIKNIVANT
jgi:8-oxo-dGTP pyrophosphatase MutT (NUDIX family)